MRLLVYAAMFSICAMSAPCSAQMVETHVTASNGVVVDKNADDFAGRAEYTAPSIKFSASQGRGSGSALVAKIRKGGTLGPLVIDGFIVYSGDWQYFEAAVFKGGDPVDFRRTGGDVGRCRYGCTLTENFRFSLSPVEIQKHAETGAIQVQIRASKTGSTAIIVIPTSYIDAVNEVAK